MWQFYLQSAPIQQVQQTVPQLVKPVQYQQYAQNANRAPAESSYWEVGLNDEAQNVVPPVKEIAQNSLILNTAPSTPC